MVPGSSPYALYFGQNVVYAAYSKKCRVVITDSLGAYALYWHFFFLWDTALGDCVTKSKHFNFKAVQKTAVRSVLIICHPERSVGSIFRISKILCRMNHY